MKITLLDTDNSSILLQSILVDIYNHHLPTWYVSWGLLAKEPVSPVVEFQDSVPVLNPEAFSTTLMQRFRSSLFVFKIGKLLSQYKPKKIDNYFDKEKTHTYQKEKFSEKLGELYNLLVENIQYSILGSLAATYHMNSASPQQYYADIRSQRYNAINSLQQGILSRQEFDQQYGFLSDNEYDPATPRYKEQKTLIEVQSVTPEHPGPQNFREHVQLRSSKIVFLIRKLILEAVDKSYFDKTIGELLGNEPTTIPLSRTTLEQKGVRLSGKKSFEGVDALSNFFNSSEIALVKNLTPDVVVLFPRVSGIISTRGGILSHAAIVAREQGIPILGQVPNATQIKTGTMLRVEGTKILFPGDISK